MEKIKIGILGLGTVGSGVVRMLTEHASKITSIVGRQLEVKTVVVHDLNKQRSVDLTGVKVSNDPFEIINDSEIQMMVEVMGTIDQAKDYIEAALRAGKHVVTANKDLIALHGPSLVALAREKGCDLFYEASVAGGIPILRTIVNSFAADRIVEVKGIVNGTTNFIMTQMNQNGLDYATALAQAQEKGFAEADPTNDVEGIDAAYKMVILTQFAFGMDIKLADIYVEGISKVHAADIAEAKRLGYQIKLLGRAKLIDGSIDVTVAPVLVSQTQPLANVANENNAVFVTGAAVGETMFYGPGAGELPTANSVLSDIITVSKNINMGTTGTRFNEYQTPIQKATDDQVVDPYYLALEVVDRPGQMLKLTEIMTENQASFNLLTQTELPDQRARIMLVTHEMSRQQLKKIKEALQEVADLEIKAAYKVLK